MLILAGCRYLGKADFETSSSSRNYNSDLTIVKSMRKALDVALERHTPCICLSYIADIYPWLRQIAWPTHHETQLLRHITRLSCCLQLIFPTFKRSCTPWNNTFGEATCFSTRGTEMFCMMLYAQPIPPGIVTLMMMHARGVLTNIIPASIAIHAPSCHRTFMPRPLAEHPRQDHTTSPHRTSHRVGH